MTKIVIVAGGLAIRMLPVTEEIPKCLVDINGTPLIEHQLGQFKKQGYTEFIFCVAHLADKVKAYFRDGSDFGVNIAYVQETKELMGTAGSVKLAEGLIGEDEDFIVYYGDNLTSMDFDKFIRFNREKKGIGTVCMRPLPPGYKSSSVITLDENNRIKAFLEKSSAEQIEAYKDEKQYINSGIYAFKKEVFSHIPENQNYDFAKELFPRLMQADPGLYGYVTSEFFREIGRIEKYELFKKEVKGKKDVFSEEKNRAVLLDRDGVINFNVNKLITPEQFQLIPGSAEAIRKISDAGYLVIVVTNQPDIAKGVYTFPELGTIHDKMAKLLAEKGAHVDGIYVCPHHPEKGFPGEVPELKTDCECRKPKPGLLIQAVKEFNLDKEKSWMIGDSMTDVAAGRAAGIRTIYLSSGGGSGNKEEKLYADEKPYAIKKDLNEAAAWLLLQDSLPQIE